MGKAKVDLAHAGGVEGRAETRQPRDDLVGRVRLHGVEDTSLRQRARELLEVVGDDVDIDHKARRGNVGGGEVARDLRRQTTALQRQLGRLGHEAQARLAARARLCGRDRFRGRDRLGGGFHGDARTGTAALLGSEHRKHPFSDPATKPA